MVTKRAALLSVEERNKRPSQSELGLHALQKHGKNMGAKEASPSEGVNLLMSPTFAFFSHDNNTSRAIQDHPAETVQCT